MHMIESSIIEGTNLCVRCFNKGILEEVILRIKYIKQ